MIDYIIVFLCTVPFHLAPMK